MKFTLEWIKDNLDWIETNITQLTAISEPKELKQLYKLIGKQRHLQGEQWAKYSDNEKAFAMKHGIKTKLYQDKYHIDNLEHLLEEHFDDNEIKYIENK